MIEFEILDSLPALYLKDLDLIVISDLHLGLEGSMTSQGNYVPEFQLENIKDELKKLKELSGSDRILVNGDLKNEYSTAYSEKREVEDLLDFLNKEFEDIILIKGNHDTFLDQLIEDKGLRLLESYKENEVLFIHGHEELDNKEFSTIVIGHEHPALALTDDIGVTEKVRCLLHGETSLGELFVLPAFSEISNGSEINKMKEDDLLSPILKEVDLDCLTAYAISREGGTYNFGKLQNL